MEPSASSGKDHVRVDPTSSHMANEPRTYRLLDIPAELRLHINKPLIDESPRIFPGPEELIRKRDPNQSSVAIKRACKIINEEMTPLLYDRSIFVVLSSRAIDLAWTMGLLDCSNIRKVELTPDQVSFDNFGLKWYISHMTNSYHRLESLVLDLDNNNGSNCDAFFKYLCCWHIHLAPPQFDQLQKCA
jgi:hypothetical protein